MVWPGWGASRWLAEVAAAPEWRADAGLRESLSAGLPALGEWVEGRTLRLAGVSRHAAGLVFSVQGGLYSDHLLLGRCPRVGPGALPPGAPWDGTLGVSALVRFRDGRVPLLVQSPRSVASPGRLVPSASGSAAPVGALVPGAGLDPRAWIEAELREELGLAEGIPVRLRPWGVLLDLRCGRKPELLFVGQVDAPADAARPGPEHSGAVRWLPASIARAGWARLARDRSAARILRAMAALLSGPAPGLLPPRGAPGCRRRPTGPGTAALRPRRGGG